MTTLYTMIYTAYVTAMACFALWATKQRERHRYADAGWDYTPTEEEA